MNKNILRRDKIVNKKSQDLKKVEHPIINLNRYHYIINTSRGQQFNG